jgi:membrane protein YdbS with pleckstrin-like domain
VVAHFTQPPSPGALLSHLQRKFPGGEYFSVYEAGFSGTGAHEKFCKLGIKNIVVHPGDIPRTDKEKKNKAVRKLSGMLCFDVSFALAQGVTYLVLYMSTNFIKHADEKAIWEGKPDCKPFVMKTLVEFFGYILFLAFSWGLFITISIVGKGELNWKMMYLIAFLTIGGGLFRAGHRVLNYSKTLYWVTNRMIYIQSGIFTRKRIAFARSKILLVDIEVSKIDKRFNAGTILIHFGETKLTEDGKEEKLFRKLESIKDPHNIIKLLP